MAGWRVDPNRGKLDELTVRYEIRIGLRYLYGGKRDRKAQLLAACSIAGMLLGIVMLILSSGGNPYGELTLILSMLAVAVFVLLSMFSVFITVSVLGVALGVAALTAVLAITSGFKQEFRDKVLGVNAHVIVLKSQATFAEYRDVMRTAQSIDSGVLAVQPFIFAEMLVTRGKGELSGVAIKGIDPKLVKGVLDIEKHMLHGDSLARSRRVADGPPPMLKERSTRRAPEGRQRRPDHVVNLPLSASTSRMHRAKSGAPRTAGSGPASSQRVRWIRP